MPAQCGLLALGYDFRIVSKEIVVRKGLITVFLLSCFMGASLGAQPVEKESQESFCEVVGDLARLVMTSRQSGKPMQEVMRRYISQEDPDFSNFMKSLVIGAYEEPLRYAEESKRVVITEFQNSVYLECVKSE